MRKQQQKEPSPLITVNEVAEILGFSIATIYRAVPDSIHFS